MFFPARKRAAGPPSACSIAHSRWPVSAFLQPSPPASSTALSSSCPASREKPLYRPLPNASQMLICLLLSFRSCFRKQGAPDDESFCSADKAIFRSNPDGLQGKATQYADKKAAQTVCNAYENGFLYCCCIKKQYSPGRREKIRALCRTGPKTRREIKQKSHLNESDGFLVGDERIELPQVESESTALPLCKSPIFCCVSRH